MGRRSTKAQDKALGALIVWGAIIGLPVYLIVKAGEAVGWPVLIGGVAALIVGILWYRHAQAKADEAERARQIEARRSALLQKYGDAQVVERIMSRSYWQGQTAEQLRDSLGDPADIDEKVLKTKSKQVWKYQQTGVNRFALRIIVENDSVVGWDEKI